MNLEMPCSLLVDGFFWLLKLEVDLYMVDSIERSLKDI